MKNIGYKQVMEAKFFFLVFAEVISDIFIMLSDTENDMQGNTRYDELDVSREARLQYDAFKSFE